MCQYTYCYYVCGHDYFIVSDTMEFCANRSVSAHSVDAWTVDMCKDLVVECLGMSRYYCNECSEDHLLEFQLDE